MSRLCVSLENPSARGFSNPFWVNCFKHAAGYCRNFELVESEINSEINPEGCAYRVLPSCLCKYLFSLMPEFVLPVLNWRCGLHDDYLS